jgi:hypothetical protein
VCDAVCEKTPAHMHVKRHPHSAVIFLWSSFMRENTNAMLHQCTCVWENTSVGRCSFKWWYFFKLILISDPCMILLQMVIMRVYVFWPYFITFVCVYALVACPISQHVGVCHALFLAKYECVLPYPIFGFVCLALFTAFPKLGTKLVVCCLVSKIVTS